MTSSSRYGMGNSAVSKKLGTSVKWKDEEPRDVAPKRYEGHTSLRAADNPYDTTLAKSAALGKSLRSGEMLSSNLKKLQNKDEDTVEDKYIKSLQDEIKYLEYELKLLKDKEAEQQAAFTEVDKFFADGVPINENILALKNQYVKYKTEKEKSIADLVQKIKDKDLANEEAKKHIDMIDAKIRDLNETLHVRKKKYENFMDEMKKQEIFEDFTRNKVDDEVGKMQGDIKKLNEENITLNRNIEKDKNNLPKKKEDMHTLRGKTRKELEDKEIEFEKLKKELDKLRVDAKDMPMLKAIQDENMGLEGKRLNIDKEHNMIQAKINELMFTLAARRKEREKEFEDKKELQGKLNELKSKLEDEAKFNTFVLEERVKTLVEQEIFNTKKAIEKKKGDLEYMKKKIEEYEQRMDDLGEEKTTNKREYILLDEELENKKKDSKNLGNSHTNARNEFKFLAGKLDELNPMIEPLQKEINVILEKIPDLEKKNAKLKDQLALFEKKMNALQLLKNFNLDEMKVIVEANTKVNSAITSLRDRWDNFQREFKPNGDDYH